MLQSYLGLGALPLFRTVWRPMRQLRSFRIRQSASAKPQHHPAKAKNCIFLFMEGGVSQMDTFEYKPAL